jgi:hypothetical protein
MVAMGAGRTEVIMADGRTTSYAGRSTAPSDLCPPPALQIRPRRSCRGARVLPLQFVNVRDQRDYS